MKNNLRAINDSLFSKRITMFVMFVVLILLTLLFILPGKCTKEELLSGPMEPYRLGILKMEPFLEKRSNDIWGYSLIFLIDNGSGNLEIKEFVIKNQPENIIYFSELPKIGETVWIRESNFLCGEKANKCHKVEIWGEAK